MDYSTEQLRLSARIPVKQYRPGRWHWLIHEHTGEPSAPRAILLTLTLQIAGLAAAAQFAGVIDMRALF